MAAEDLLMNMIAGEGRGGEGEIDGEEKKKGDF